MNYTEKTLRQAVRELNTQIKARGSDGRYIDRGTSFVSLEKTMQGLGYNWEDRKVFLSVVSTSTLKNSKISTDITLYQENTINNNLKYEDISQAIESIGIEIGA